MDWGSIIGAKYSRLTVISLAGRNTDYRMMLNCICECGKEVLVNGKSIRDGHTKSCGCLHRDTVIDRNKKNAIYKVSNPVLYAIWRNMIDRCENPKNKRYKNYGSRGIKVCEEWHDFDVFYSDVFESYQKGLTLDRRGNDGHYEKSNFRWVTDDVQRRNKSNNFYIEYNGERKIVADWAKQYDIPAANLCSRLKRGFKFEDAVSLPPQKGNKYSNYKKTALCST